MKNQHGQTLNEIPWLSWRIPAYFIAVAFIVVGLGLNCFAVTTPVAGRQAAGQIVGQDDFGRTVVLKKPPERIVLLSGSPIDLIYELGAGDALVGVVDSIDVSYPETLRRYPSLLEKEKVGRFSNPNIEKIVALDPDLIIPFASSENPGKFTCVFEKRGMPYAAFVSVESLDFGLAQILRMGRLLGRDAKAKNLALKIRTEVENLSNMVTSKIKDRPLVYYWWGARNGTYGAKTAINELIQLAGGVNLAGQFDRQYMELSPEYVIKSDPDVILISFWKESQKDQRVAALKKRPGFSGIRAVKNNRIYTINGHSFHSTVRFAEVVRTLARYIHPELFKFSRHIGARQP